MALYNSASTSNFREYANNARFNDPIRQTISIWVNPTSAAPAAQQIWVARGDGTVSGEWTCGTPASATFQVARASVTTGSGLQSVADTLQWTQRKWFHYCQTYDSVTNDLRLYIDGKLRANSTPAGSWTITTTAAVRLWMRTGLQNPGDQYVEQFGWWRTVFRPDEIDAISRGGPGSDLFTRIRRDDALILDPLRDPSQRELVAGLGVNTGTITQREAATIVLRSPNTPLAKPFLYPTATRKRYVAVVSAGGPVTVAITGVAGTGSVGTVIPSTTAPVTGNTGTSAVGTVAPATTVPVTGNAATGSAGSVTEDHPGTVAATGVSAAAAVGSVTPSTAVAPSGVAGTSSAGTVAPATALPVTGVVGTGSPGTVAPATTVAATGNAATGAVGSVGASQAGSVGLTGVAATASPGSVTPATSVATTGVAATGSPGTVTPSTSLPITGAAAAGAAGNVGTALTVGITGVSATGAVGTVTGVGPSGNVTVALTGVFATGSVGTVTVTGGDTTRTAVYRTLSLVLARFDTSLALVTAATSTDGQLRSTGHRFTLEREPLPQMDGDYFADVEAITPAMRQRAIGEAYWEATVVVRLAYYRGGGDAAGGDRQSVMRNGLGDAMRLADIVENPVNYDSPNTGISEVRYQGAVRAATFKRGEIWETRFLVRWRSDSYVVAPAALWPLPANAKVMLLGDSITASNSWTTSMQAAAVAHYGANAPTFYNYAVSGYECSNVAADLVPDLAAVPNPTHAVVRVGINDIIHGRALSSSVASINLICVGLITGGISPGNVLIVDNLVWGERPVDGDNTAAGGNDAGILAINQAWKAAAAKYGFVYAETRDRYWRPWEAVNNTSVPAAGHGIFTDPDDGYPGQLGVHPTTPAGRDLLGNWVLSNYVKFTG